MKWTASCSGIQESMEPFCEGHKRVTSNVPVPWLTINSVDLGFVQPRTKLAWTIARSGSGLITRELQRRADLKKVPGVADGLDLHGATLIFSSLAEFSPYVNRGSYGENSLATAHSRTKSLNYLRHCIVRSLYPPAIDSFY